MKTEFGTNQAVWRWELTNGDKEFPRKIIFRNLEGYNYDYIYVDPDRITELIDWEHISDFIDYAAGKLNMTEDDKEWLEYMMGTYNWNNIRYCIDILDNDVPKEFHEFLIKYNFRIYLNVERTLN